MSSVGTLQLGERTSTFMEAGEHKAISFFFFGMMVMTGKWTNEW